jgi:hypothetical protein
VLRQDTSWLGQLVDDQGAEVGAEAGAEDRAEAAAGTEALAEAEDRAEVEAGAEVEALAAAAAEDGVTSVFAGALTSLDSDARLLWLLAASTPTATATATVRVPAVMRTARFRFRGPLAAGRSSN